MCFSPEADVVGGVVICAVGVDAVRHIRQRREFLALAWIPVLLGVHQFIEALVWLWLQGHVPRGVGHVALWAYLLIAFVVLPVFVPAAVIDHSIHDERPPLTTVPAGRDNHSLG